MGLPSMIALGFIQTPVGALYIVLHSRVVRLPGQSLPQSFMGQCAR